MKHLFGALVVGAMLAASVTVALNQKDPNAASARYAVENSGVPHGTTVGPRIGLVVQTPVHLHS